MFPAARPLLSQRLLIPAVLLVGSIALYAHAQDGNESCPCFSYEEVESIFLKEGHLIAEAGESYCTVEDYSVEIKAEMSVRDQNYDLIAQARVAWFDYDPSSCSYIEVAEPGSGSCGQGLLRYSFQRGREVGHSRPLQPISLKDHCAARFARS
jgi:hypothetical protein